MRLARVIPNCSLVAPYPLPGDLSCYLLLESYHQNARKRARASNLRILSPWHSNLDRSACSAQPQSCSFMHQHSNRLGTLGQSAKSLRVPALMGIAGPGVTSPLSSRAIPNSGAGFGRNISRGLLDTSGGG